jgi:uncharacterized membrane protein SirB2
LLYLYVKQFHVFSVLSSIALFMFRGGLMFAGSRLLFHPLVKFSPHVVDTLLLTSALWLMSLAHQYPFVQDWLTVKVVLLVVYIVLGSFALKRGRSKFQRGVFFASALLVILFMLTVARTHQPLGIFSGWAG